MIESSAMKEEDMIPTKLLNLFIVSLLALLFLPTLHANSSSLVNVNWLKEHADKPNLVIVDLRDSHKFQQGHIKNAVNIPASRLNRTKNNVPNMMVSPKDFQNIVEQAGIKNNHLIVLYGDKSFFYSMRAYWIFNFYGHQNIKVLDGGIQDWVESDFPLSDETTTPNPSKFVIQINPNILATKFSTFMATKSDQIIIIDARSKPHFYGDKSQTNRKGHIPTAINKPWLGFIYEQEKQQHDLINKPTHLINLNSIKEMFADIPKNKDIILYCNGGDEAAVLYFALKEIGRKAAIYDGSWFEWSTDKNMPITTLSPN